MEICPFHLDLGLPFPKTMDSVRQDTIRMTYIAQEQEIDLRENFFSASKDFPAFSEETRQERRKKKIHSL